MFRILGQYFYLLFIIIMFYYVLLYYVFIDLNHLKLQTLLFPVSFDDVSCVYDSCSAHLDNVLF